jgi:microcompartment protein CcmK/EutM
VPLVVLLGGVLHTRMEKASQLIRAAVSHWEDGTLLLRLRVRTSSSIGDCSCCSIIIIRIEAKIERRQSRIREVRRCGAAVEQVVLRAEGGAAKQPRTEEKPVVLLVVIRVVLYDYE